jgi:hypothetical protein
MNNDKHPSERAMRFLIGRYLAAGFATHEVCERFRAMFARRQLGTSCMAARLSWYGLRQPRRTFRNVLIEATKFEARRMLGEVS